MTNRDKQTEETARDICRSRFAEDAHLCKECESECLYYQIATALSTKGYRLETEVALEVIRGVELILEPKIISIEEDFFHGTAAHWDATRKGCYEEILIELAELKKKYTENKQ